MDGIQRATIGRAGEHTATLLAQEAGLTVIDRNWRDGRTGELDIVADERGRVVVIEVRTRVGIGRGTALESVDQRKVVRLRRLSARWLETHEVEARLRIDVVAITLDPTRVYGECALITDDTDLRIFDPRIQWLRSIS